MASPFNLHTLPNGLRVVHRRVPHVDIVHIGITFDVGSRDESEVNNGIAHFIEHTVFKGTSKRKSHHILRRVESVGGELNAYTTREKTCFYTASLKKYGGRSTELLADLVSAATFPEAEVEREKNVILEEIDMYEDTPDESIYDTFYTRLFGNHPMGYNILGTKESVNGLKREDLKAFFDENYVTSRGVLSIVGNLSASRAFAMAERYFGNIKPGTPKPARIAPQPVLPFNEVTSKDFTQTHCLLGGVGPSRHSDERYALALVNNVLGASGMSSRLNMAVREKYGLTYHISSHYGSYHDAGVFSVYFAADGKNLERCQSLVLKELKNFKDKPLTGAALTGAKRQLLGYTAMLVENNASLMQYQARGVIDYGAPHEFKDFVSAVEKLSADEVAAVVEKYLDPKALSTLVYKGEKEE